MPRPNNLKHNITITKRKYTLPKLISLIAISQSILLSSVLITSCGSGKLTDPVRQAADESIVMLRNNQSKLPLTQNDTVSIFGRTQIDYHFMGGGSGGLVVPKYTVNVLQGLRNSNLKINEDLASIYENWCADNPPSFLSEYEHSYPEAPIVINDNNIVTEAREKSNTAVVVIGRTAGEDVIGDVGFSGGDFRNPEKDTSSDFSINDDEKALIDAVTTADFEKVILVLNYSNIVDFSWLANYGNKIDGILLAWEGGMESGNAIADVLSGKVNPSGKLPDTIANNYADYPSADYYDDPHQEDEDAIDGDILSIPGHVNYVEDIYVGYRYFETFDKTVNGATINRPLYDFGYGLSYTTFDIATQSYSEKNKLITLKVKVTNTGKCSGKEIVQVYMTPPQGVLAKSKKNLVAFAKTANLKPGKSQNLTLTFDLTKCASFNDDPNDGITKSSWVLESGDYRFFVGNSVTNGSYINNTYRQRATEIVKAYPVDTLAPQEPESGDEDNPFVQRWGGGSDQPIGTPVPYSTLNNADGSPNDAMKTLIQNHINLETDIPFDGVDHGIKLIDVYNAKDKDHKMQDFIKQFTIDDLAFLTVAGQGMDDSRGIPGNTAVIGGVTDRLKDTFGIPIVSNTDGPSGVRCDEQTLLLPDGTALASTWNTNLINDVYATVGKEAKRLGSSQVNGPGMNIHRNVRNGRNFEYYSEDPYLTGEMGKAAVTGIQSQGISAAVKHLAVNNREAYRYWTDSRVSERALREIYLKGFEKTIAEAHPWAVMTSYNSINGVPSYYNFELGTLLLRDQWDFTGLIITDWYMWNSGIDPNYPDLTNSAYRIRSGINVYMPGGSGPEGAIPIPIPWNTDQQQTIIDAYNNGDLEGREVETSAIQLLNFIMLSSRFREDHHLPYAK